MIFHPEQAPYLNLIQMLLWTPVVVLVYWAVLKVYASLRMETEGEAVLRVAKRIRENQVDRLRGGK